MEKTNVSLPIKIEDIPGELTVHPLHYYKCKMILSIPEYLRTVDELRNEINNHPENEFLLNEVLNDIKNIITLKPELLMENTVKELYDMAYGSTEMLCMNLYIELLRKALVKK